MTRTQRSAKPRNAQAVAGSAAPGAGATIPLAEAASRLGVSVSTLYRRLEKGTIPQLRAFKGRTPFDSHKWFVPVAAINDILSQAKEAPNGNAK